ncbi:hypothetical protein [Pseudomonas sp. GW531-T4]|uniref:hypothetical protein n=1 Tax=Pseudomonas sp. GW531-T4 TaxID=2075553 RepID=UPI000CD2641A|nr:hypothetical protein [Pseudomonas sp. GW531-T4]POA75338.1 hypothetical protein C1888_00095 [Pseudomonas sp. GW531-T4]
MKPFWALGAVLSVAVSVPAFAADYPVKTLQANSFICFDYDDWQEMISASVDEDQAAMMRLVSSGACRMVSKTTKVSYLDKAAGGVGSLIQMPSGKTAYTADAFLK